MTYICRNRSGHVLHTTTDLLAACSWHRAHEASHEVARQEDHQVVPLLVRVPVGGLPAFSRRRRPL